MSKKLLLKRSYADTLKGCVVEKRDEPVIIEDTWADGEPGYVNITPAMCTFPYRRPVEKKVATSPAKKMKKKTKLKRLISQLPSFDEWEPEVRYT